MSWVNDLASGLGIPSGAATLAVAIYSACTAAEKVARPERLTEVGAVLADKSWAQSAQPSRVIESIFQFIFGQYHFSYKCISRSIVATLVFSIAVGLVFLEIFPPFFGPLIYVITQLPIDFGIIFVLCGIIPDYLSLLKARLLIRFLSSRYHGVFMTIAVVVVDIIVSITISVVSFLILYGAVWIFFSSDTDVVPLDPKPPLGRTGDALIGNYRPIQSISFDTAGAYDRTLTDGQNVAISLILMAISFFSSTLLTSVWIILILLSSSVLKFIVPLQRFTVWFFDVSRRPLQAIGIVAGALTMIVAGVASLLRSLR